MNNPSPPPSRSKNSLTWLSGPSKDDEDPKIRAARYYQSRTNRRKSVVKMPEFKAGKE